MKRNLKCYVVCLSVAPSKKLVAYLDATGGLIRPPRSNNQKILYYSLVVPVVVGQFDPADPFPLTDMISSSHNRDTIGGWLR